MIKRSLTVLALVALFATTLNAQWTNEGGWPDTTYKGGTHAIAVDPDGKVWVASYYQDVPWAVAEGDTVATSGILVFNPDGTEADISPITHVLFDGGFTVDTLNGNCRGMETDENGNIVYVQSGPSKAIKINYQTGEGMAKKLTTEHGSSPTAPSIADDGTIFIGPVVGGGGTAIAMYDTDLNYIGNAVDGPQNISRVLTVSGDGNTIYWHAFTGPIHTVVYQRADEFSPYDSIGVIMEGVSVESSHWHPSSGKLWVSHDARGPAELAHLSWNEYDTATDTWGDSFVWEPSEDATEYPRGIDFSPDGMTAYVGTFTTATPRIQKFTKGAAEPASVTFICDMSVQVDIGEFDPGTGTLVVAGSFNEWSTTATPMTDGDSDLKYEVTVDGLTSGEEIAFKFVKDGDGWEGISDRVFTPAAGSNTFEAFFNDFVGGTTVTVQFLADMEFEIVSGRFDPSADTLSARGSFNGWSSDDVLAPSVSNPNVYEAFVDMDVNVEDEIFYKFAYNYGAGGTNWEGGSDRTYMFTADDITNQFAVVERVYNDLTIDEILQQAAEITFVVDMNGAINNLTGTEFTAVENVFIAGAVPPLNWPGGGWPDDDADLVHFLNDDGGGMWSVTLTFPQYSPLTIQYKYGANWGLPSNGGANDNEAGVGEDHFLMLTPAVSAGTVTNVFGETGEHELDEGTSVKELDFTANTYALDQNYPNPFNPTTNIRFSVPEAGLVTLRVYDLLGQEVASLLNEYKNAGSYEVTFDASELTTGMYVYTITSGNFVATKKMMLVK